MNIPGLGKPDIRKLEKDGKKWDLANIIIEHWGDRDLVKEATRALRRIGNPAIDALADALHQLKKNEGSLPLSKQEIKKGMQIREHILDFAKQADPSKLSPHARRAFDGAKRWMLDLADHKDPEVRIMAVLTFGRMADRDAIPVILKLLQDKDGMVRAMAAESLAEYKDEKVVEPLLVALSDKDANVRWGAVYSLGKMEGGPVLGPLLRALEDESDDVRMVAALSLGKLGNPEAAGALKAHLKDKDLEVRKSSAEALGKIDPKEAFGSVRAAYNYELLLPPFREARDVLLIFLDVEVIAYYYHERLLRRLKRHFKIIEESYAIWSELMAGDLSYTEYYLSISAPSKDGKTCPVMLLLEDSDGELVVDIRNFRKMDRECQERLIAILLKTMDEYLIAPRIVTGHKHLISS